MDSAALSPAARTASTGHPRQRIRARRPGRRRGRGRRGRRAGCHDPRPQHGLVEAGDWASGTSSRSSKLIHGGLRYLEMLDFALVREALTERGLLLRLARHLIRPVPFLYPLQRRFWERRTQAPAS